MAITHYSNADWIVAWDSERQGHVYLRGGDLVFDGNTIAFVGGGYSGTADQVIDGTGLCLMPGFVDIHAHPATEIFYRGLREDHSAPEHYMSGLYERSCAYSAHIDLALLPVGAEALYAELMQSGVTTLVDIIAPYEGWLDVMARSVLRMFAAPTFETSRWTRDNVYQLKFVEDVPKGEAAYKVALDFISEARAHPCGWIDGVVSPSTIDKVIPELLIESRAEAKRRGLRWTTHTSRGVLEFQVMVERHGVSPIQVLAERDLLGEGLVLGHAILPDDSSWIGWHSRTDVSLPGDSQTGVAHCPTPFMRYGTTMESFGRYLEAGVVLGIGTETIPHNFIEDMRSAAILGRVAEHDGNTASTSDVFHAGTVGGARAAWPRGYRPTRRRGEGGHCRRRLQPSHDAAVVRPGDLPDSLGGGPRCKGRLHRRRTGGPGWSGDHPRPASRGGKDCRRAGAHGSRRGRDRFHGPHQPRDCPAFSACVGIINH